MCRHFLDLSILIDCFLMFDFDRFGLKIAGQNIENWSRKVQ